MEITRGNTQTTVASKFKMYQNADNNNEWVINIDWTAPTIPPADDFATLKDNEKRTLRLVGLHYVCKDSVNPCTLKAFLKEMFKVMTQANYDELLVAVDAFKTAIKGEGFDPSIISKIHVIQSHNHATHSTKT
jgi:hypothetical protein